MRSPFSLSLPRVLPLTKSLPRKLARFSPVSSSTLIEPSQLTSLASCGRLAVYWEDGLLATRLKAISQCGFSSDASLGLARMTSTKI
jgi:hypothetical protein